MGDFLNGISEIFLALAILDLIVVVYLTRKLYHLFRDSLTSITEKESGPIYSYRKAIFSLLNGQADPFGWFSLIHLVVLHLIVPLMGIGLLLHTDWNFLAVIAGIAWSYQIAMRLYPGYEVENSQLTDQIAPGPADQ
ncbi:MAG: hypothetical protein KDK39_00125 [Leptospiraceae bacterium]|nr:hypothetical protein [Leptospiraceae bacterium]